MRVNFEDILDDAENVILEKFKDGSSIKTSFDNVEKWIYEGVNNAYIKKWKQEGRI